MHAKTIHKKQYNALILLKSFAHRLYLSDSLAAKFEKNSRPALPNYFETLQQLNNTLQSKAHFSEEDILTFINVLDIISVEFPTFFKQAPVTIEQKICAVYGSFQAEKMLQIDLMYIQSQSEKSDQAKINGQIQFYDEKLQQIGNMIRTFEDEGELTMQQQIQLNTWYNNLLGIKQQFSMTLQAIPTIVLTQ
jgi:hypothetical protein